jgi:myo-inositol-1(or 4)-monophosphatase
MAAAAAEPRGLPDPEALRVLAEQAARAGGETARRYFGRELTIQFKDDDSEVSEADHAAQSVVVDVLRSHRPHDAFLTEEEILLSPPTPSPADARICWVVDPLDGTRNFVRNVPLYVCSVAAVCAGAPVAAAIYDPVHDTLYSGALGRGVLVDDEPRAAYAGCRRRSGIYPKPVVTVPSTPGESTRRMAHAWLERYVCRSLGCTALQMAWVAAGKLDAMLADNPRLWDLAAGALLITEMGGAVVSLDGSPLFPLDVSAYRGEPVPMIAVHEAARLSEFLSP